MSDPMTESVKEALAEVGAKVLAEQCNYSWDRTPISKATKDSFRRQSGLVLAALLAKPISVPCETCGGSGTDVCGISTTPCDVCHGSGSIEVELMVGEQVGFWHREYGFEVMKHGIAGEENSGEPVYRKVSLEGAP